MPVDTADVTQLALTAKALSDPIRLKMIGILAERKLLAGKPPTSLEAEIALNWALA